MKFNNNKFEVHKHGKDEELKKDFEYFTPEYKDIVKRKEVLRDLGVQANEKANFDDHINKVCTSVNRKVGWVLRSFNNRIIGVMKLLWNQIIQGHIDYGSQLWQPQQSSSLKRIENLLRSFSKSIPDIRNENYWKRLEVLKMNSQQRRMECYRIIYTCKALENIVPDCGIKGKKQVRIKIWKKL
jgi:hypothetical protein